MSILDKHGIDTTVLNLNKSKLDTLDLIKFKKLLELDCSYNQITLLNILVI